MGNPFEFGNPKRKEVADYIRSSKPLIFTDDTQMTLAGVWGLAEGTEHTDLGSIQEAYIQWWHGQTLQNTDYFRKNRNDYPGLLRYSAFTALEAPGDTCLKSLYLRANHRVVINDSNGCGTVMRMLPFIYLAQFKGESYARNLAHAAAAITHKGDEIATSTEHYFDYVFRGRVHRVQGYIKSGGFTALDCLYMAIDAVEQNDTFEGMLEQSIAHPGDSDSVAAVASALWAIHHGVPKNFARYLKRLRGKDVIHHVSQAWLKTYGCYFSGKGKAAR